MSNREYRVWHENGDVLWVAFNDDMGLYAPAGQVAEDTASRHRDKCQCGEEAGSEGLFCGTLHPHGIFVQVCEGDDDVTQDYLINGGE